MNRPIKFLFAGLGVVLLLGAMIAPATAQTSTWRAQYFNNASWSGTPTATATLPYLNVYWGNNPPAGGMAADYWSARFNAMPYFNAAIYRFTVHADDAFRLYVNGNLLLDTTGNPLPDRTLTVDTSLPAGNANIQVDFREYTGVAFLNVSWQQIGSPPPLPPSVPGVWSAQYFNNPSLTGMPMYVGSLPSLDVNWGNNPPIPGMPADQWSARFNGVISFTPGRYRLNVTADDAFRLYVNGRVVIDTWNAPRPNRLFSYEMDLGGAVNLQVDFREAIGPAFINLSWQRLDAAQPPAQQPTTAPVTSTWATITAGVLNVRSAPMIDNNILTRVRFGESYPVMGCTAVKDWYQVRVGQLIGWVYWQYIDLLDGANVPVIDTQTRPPDMPTTPTGYTLRATANLNIRSGPSISTARLSLLPYNASADIIGRNANNSWWMIQYGRVTGWVSGRYVTLPAGMDANRVPIV